MIERRRALLLNTMSGLLGDGGSPTASVGASGGAVTGAECLVSWWFSTGSPPLR